LQRTELPKLVLDDTNLRWYSIEQAEQRYFLATKNR